MTAQVPDQFTQDTAKALLSEVATHLADSQSPTPYIPQALQQQVLELCGLTPAIVPAHEDPPAREVSSSEPLD